MNTSLTLSLDKRRVQKNSSYPIVLRLTHFRKSTSISTGKSVPIAFWNESKKKVRSNYKETHEVASLNTFLLKEITNAQDIINKLHENQKLDYLSLKELRQKIVNKNKYDSFLGYGKKLVDELRKAKRIGTARSYNDLINILTTYNQQKDIKFNEVNVAFLKCFEQFHMSKEGNSINGLASYMRTLRAIYNKGIKEGLIDKEAYPFELYKIKTVPTAKRAIDKQYLKKLVALELKEGSWPFHYRNYFLISYMLFGMSFIDMAFLKIGNMVDGRVKFQRRKTSKIYDIKITTQLKEILNHYTKDKNIDDYILPIIHRNTLEHQYLDVKGARKRYNRGLIKLAEQCGIEEHLTSYVSRHSFATHAMLKNIPLQAISSMLGHTKLNTTQIYLKSLPSSVIDGYQEQLNSI